MRVALDTNVLLRFANRNDAQSSQVHERLTRLVERGHHPCIANQNLYEFWSVATRPVAAVNGLGLSTKEAEMALRCLLDAFVLLPDPPDLLERWLYLCVRYQVAGRTSHDARIAAWMVAHGIRDLYTLNPADFRRFDEISVLDES